MSKAGALAYDAMNGVVTAHCRACDGERYLHAKRDNVTCGDCKGQGEIHCDTGGLSCAFAYCYCEAAWDRQQEGYSL